LRYNSPVLWHKESTDMSEFVLVIDQGTSSTRAMIFNQDAQVISVAQRLLPQSFPQDGWVEHDPSLIWQHVLELSQEAIERADIAPHQLAGLGISNQRETTIIWDKRTGEPIYPAIVWQDRRTAPLCEAWLSEGLEEAVAHRTGLLLDPYFSASKIRWLLDNIPGARARALQGDLLFGTVDTFLIWQFTAGQQHVTDATNASRTLLFNIHEQSWDETLLDAFDIPANLLPIVKNNSDDFGLVSPHLLGAPIPIVAVAGDQQAATIGQCCFKAGMMKSTYGTGCFMLLNTGEKPVFSRHRLLTTTAYRLNDKPIYALEGSIFVAGAAVQWLRDAAKMISNAADTEQIAMGINHTDGVYLVPAFTGLGAPYWDPLARGAILGLTRESGVSHIVRATLESVCYQSKDLWLAMQADGAEHLDSLRVDGGMVVNDWLMQFLSDMLNVPVERPQTSETTALGIAFLAGLQLGWYQSLAEIAQHWRASHIFKPQMQSTQRESLYSGWLDAVNTIRSK
jgi:glycerol kinase